MTDEFLIEFYTKRIKFWTGMRNWPMVEWAFRRLGTYLEAADSKES